MRTGARVGPHVFTHPDGDKLVLRPWPRYDDFEDLEEEDTERNHKQLERMRALGIVKGDLGEQMKNATPELLAAAKEANAAEKAGMGEPWARRFKLGRLAVELHLGRDKLGGQAILDAYDDLYPGDREWVDTCVHEVWTKGELATGERADAGAGAEELPSQGGTPAP